MLTSRSSIASQVSAKIQIEKWKYKMNIETIIKWRNNPYTYSNSNFYHVFSNFPFDIFQVEGVIYER